MNNFSLSRRGLLGAALAGTLPAIAAPARLPVVASFSILADLTRQVGGERVDVTALVGADGDAHVFEPTPRQAGQLQQARVLVSNGLGFEPWLARLKRAAAFKGLEIVASQGIQPRALPASAHGSDHGHKHAHAHAGTQDPHAWQDVRNAIVYVQNIARGLALADAPNADHYRARAADYVARLGALDARLRAQFAGVPAERRSVISTHDAFGYFAQAYGLRFIAVRGLSTESEPSARDMARLVKQVRDERIGALFLENISDPRLLQQLARETGATLGGRLHSDALSAPDGPAPTYIDMVQANAAVLLKAMAPAAQGAAPR
ncbi:zinc ABC transporter substrate-binding protein [Acidovorax sp. CCYZU-2555]|uniref:metal ABC transporter solute-binding protein, Zn/Mn family n=1 Tax=Acidovorax sp. CCYZU-2555 TaxID=2835042 RepID=UPI001BCC3A05|nr:zinc ABC transporter substrate-binding protein [Acidovorax sp. CCYZU-2555]MBS7781411.1 zinc ABC transporter substrate-binding protein [Acidovorax sp. CCYZU-2555]